MRAIIRLGFVAASMLTSASAFAASMQPFTPSAFEAAKQAGGPVVIDVYAPWCPVCAAQEPTLNALEADPAYKNVTLLRVDFDRQKTVLRDLNVQQHSTVIAYHGGHEVERVSGQTGRAAIEAVFAASLKN